VRDPVSTLSDLRAQRAACLVGERRVAELAARYSPVVLSRVFDLMLDSVERAVRLDLTDLPDGAAEAEGFLDDDGIGGAPTLIRAAALIWPDRAVASSTVAFFGMNLESASPRTGVPSVMAEVAGGGTGAHSGGDGLDGVDTYMANVGLMPVEVAESSYSVRI